MFKKKLPLILVTISAIFIFESCVSSTRVVIDSKPSNADVYSEGQYLGKTPVSTKLSNLVWDDPDIILSKEGYNNMPVTLKREPKIPNIVIGYFVNIFAYLWCYGPKENQCFVLTPIDE